MIRITIYILLTVFFQAAFSQIPPSPKVQYYTQVIDHYDFSVNPATFSQKYLVYDGYFDSSAQFPLVFFYTGNEGAIESFYNNSGYVFTLAQEFKALVVFMEHRYYGTTQPFGKQSHLPQNIKYLTIEQVLLDYATFLSTTFNNNHITITFGGSYGGSLSAYMRMHHPNVVSASLAASAPLMLYDGYTPSSAFMDVVSKDFQDQGCASLIKQAFSEIQNGDVTQTGKNLRICGTMQGETDRLNMAMWARNAFVNMAMLDYPYPTNFEAPLPAWPVAAGCKQFGKRSSQAEGGATNWKPSEQQASLLPQLADTVGVFYNGTGQLPCFNITQEFFICSDPSGCGGSRTDVNALSWDYEACTEAIHNIGANASSSMFLESPWSLDGLKTYCKNTWGVVPRVNWMIKMNTPLEESSRIIFSNGMLDPWKVGGVYVNSHFLKTVLTHWQVSSQTGLELISAPQDPHKHDLISILIADSAHHLDLRFPNPQDPKSVTMARAQERDILARWIQEIRHEKASLLL